MSVLTTQTTSARHSQLSIGHEKNSVIIVDNFHPEPEKLVDSAAIGDSFIADKNNFYPGKQKLVDENYQSFLKESVKTLIREAYLIDDRASFKTEFCAFSLTSTPVHQLKLIQKIPHIDTHQPLRYAVIHYICDERFGGTSFYRHRSTGFESINEQRLRPYFEQLKSEVTKENLADTKAPNYIRDSNALFEKIAEVELKFNRALIYPSNLLHSGNIDPLLGLSTDPRSGRLTVNAFISMA